MKPALIALCLALVSTAADAASFSFQNHGKPVRTVPAEELQKLSTPEKTRVYQPHEDAEIEFTGLPLRPLLDQVYGSAWRKAEEALFICADGYRAPVPVARIRDHVAWLAFNRLDRKSFTLTEQKPKPHDVGLSPYFLIWDTLHDPDSRAVGLEGWPYQVVGIDLIEFRDKYPGLVPAQNASPRVKSGFQLFRKYCISCHALGGQGGKVGPELGSPVSVTEYFKTPWLRKWIANPSSLRAGTPMPSVVPKGPEQARQIDDIIHYLRAMAKLPPA